MTPSFIFYMDIIGTIAFAISGVMVAVRKDMDAFGINILADGYHYTGNSESNRANANSSS